ARAKYDSCNAFNIDSSQNNYFFIAPQVFGLIHQKFVKN
ncbi:hypothetical protein J2Y45_006468, partial [Dyadobacter sp. BE34]|nr:hypothetical protein [Dyadobacter sp. BE34]MDR7263482.1 hypothetical protein [Dyadobacter sp. BE32]